MKRLIRQWAAGVAIRADGDLADALFLHEHPGWSWRDLQDAPAVVVKHLRAIDAAVSARKARG